MEKEPRSELVAYRVTRSRVARLNEMAKEGESASVVARRLLDRMLGLLDVVADK